MTDLKQFQYVLALSQCLNFSQAAAKLHISQSSLSQYIRNLEQQLGVDLFDRSASSLRLTQYGEIYIRGARRILDTYAEMRSGISEADEGHGGTVSVGISPTRAQFFVPGIVSAFTAKYPCVALRFVEAKSASLMRSLDDGGIDLALTVAADGIDSDEYTVIPAGTEEIMLAAPKSAAVETDKDGKVDFSALGTTEFITLDENQMLTGDFRRLCKKSSVKPPVSLSVTELSTAVALVRSGHGVTLLPSSYRRCAELADTLRFYPIVQSNTKRRVVIIHRRGKYLSTPERELVGILSDSV